jgi:NADH-quinone oxidoreductase subunit C
MSDTEAPPALPGDGLREGIVDELRRRIGDSLVATELKPNDDLWVRIAPEAWQDAGEALYQMGFEYFCFLSAIDWLPSPYGRGEDDPTEPAPARSTEVRPGVTGGDTRFQLLARVSDIRRHVGVTLKADVPEDTLTIGSWFSVYAGANWHERETHEMFGIVFAGHPDLRNMYLPTDFEGFPLRKDFPLLARMVKPWPGIVDVEPMPAEEAPEDDAVTGELAPENPTPAQADAGLGAAPDEAAAGEAAVAHSVEEAPDHQAPPAGDVGRTDSGGYHDLVGDQPAGSPGAEAPAGDQPSTDAAPDAGDTGLVGDPDGPDTEVVDGTDAVYGDDATGGRDGGAPQRDLIVVDEDEVRAREGGAPTTDEAVPSGRPADEATTGDQTTAVERTPAAERGAADTDAVVTAAEPPPDDSADEGEPTS